MQVVGRTKNKTIYRTIGLKFMEKKIALITGITGQDGSYLAEFLIEKGYGCISLNIKYFSCIKINNLIN